MSAIRMRVLENSVVRLEPQVEAHADVLFNLLQDPAIYALENEPPASLQWLRERFLRLESRGSADNAEQWLNWVVFSLPATPVGFVQATVYPNERAHIAYVLGSRFWGRGLATAAVELMVAELKARYGVKLLVATLKGANARSLGLLERLGFAPAPEALRAEIGVAPDELVFVR